MPTKHKRKRGTDDDKSHYDLPPTSRARSLPVIAPTKDFITARALSSSTLSNKRRKTCREKNGIAIDDTPKNFARLMAWHTQGKKLAPALDDGTSTTQKKVKKRKIQTDAQHKTKPQKDTTISKSSIIAVNSSDIPSGTETPKNSTSTKPAKKSNRNSNQNESSQSPPTQEQPVLKIRPGESLSEFNLRVDQSLPLSGPSTTKSNPNTANLPSDLRIKARLTKHNKRLERMQTEWRATEARLRAKEEEEAEENAERDDEERVLWEDVKLSGGKLKKGKRKGVVDDDPWRELEKKRQETKQKNVRDVVLEPPVLKGVKNMFKERPGQNTSRLIGGGGYSSRSQIRV